ncbi:hypothetical protein ACFWFU_38860 [Streptomyces sp. NPDC060235]|uniref:hypothetical protein n=1 Tax=unclassified Streptomyces TaxID=2593676 RepID=UPI003651108B
MNIAGGPHALVPARSASARSTDARRPLVPEMLMLPEVLMLPDSGLPPEVSGSDRAMRV